MIANKNIDQILAIGRLYEFSSNKRFHLIKNEFITDSIGKKALELNNEIKINTGIDLFEAKSEEDLLEYEKVLNQYTTTTIKRDFKIDSDGDELELLRTQSSYPVEKMSDFDFSITANLQGEIKNRNLSTSDLINICKTPDSVSYVSDIYSYFLIKKTNIKGKQKLMLLHLSPHEPNVTQASKYRTPGKTGILTEGAIPLNHESKSLQIRMMMLFDYNSFEYLALDPVRLFIKGLDIYGYKTDINGVTKKFHRNVILPYYIKDHDRYHKFIVNLNSRFENTRIISATKFSDIAYKLNYLYGYYTDRY